MIAAVIAPWAGRRPTPAQLAEILALHRQWSVTRGRDGTRAYLAGADLTGAVLADAVLAGAYLAGADLTGADLTRAVLTRADLTGAYLAGADLAGAYLAGADLGRTLQRIGPIDGWTMVSVQWADGPRIACGCRWFTRAEAREHWGPGCADRRAHGDMMLAGLDALLAICRAHGWTGCEVLP